jgi:hypothetical protein
VPAPDLRAEPLVIGPDTVYGSERAWMIRPDGYIAGSAVLDRPNAAGDQSIV